MVAIEPLFIVQFLIGIIIGYVLKRVVKYGIIAAVIAFIAIYLGVISKSTVLSAAKRIYEVTSPLLQSIIGMVPFGVGLIVGIIIGFIFT